MSGRTQYLAKKGLANKRRWGTKKSVKVALNKDNKLVETKEQD